MISYHTKNLFLTSPNDHGTKRPPNIDSKGSSNELERGKLYINTLSAPEPLKRLLVEHTSAKLIEIKFKFLQPIHGPHGTVRQMESNETPHTPWGLRHL